MHPPTPDPEFNHNSQGGAMWENVSRTVAFLDLSNSSDLPKSPLGQPVFQYQAIF